MTGVLRRARTVRATGALFGLCLLLAACDWGAVSDLMAEQRATPTDPTAATGSAGFDALLESGDGGAGSGSTRDDEDHTASRDEVDGDPDAAGSGGDPSTTTAGNAGETGDDAGATGPTPDGSGGDDDSGDDDSGDDGSGDDGSGDGSGDGDDRAVPEDRSASDAASAGALELSSVELEILSQLDADRRAAGRAPLVLDEDLTEGAREWSRRMAAAQALQHDTSGGFAENIAYGYPTAAAVHEAWSGSEGHRRNRLNGSHSRYGIGVAAATDGTLYFTERFR